ncbi:MAG TPA: LamG-like jellyroll fold domain-containing protein [Verrucomicrobiae bacterium]|jgi:hypothetical protein|nr:LamG-like jellyroll fold domain-containing protein [Verrucomicrobiae bacterium]
MKSIFKTPPLPGHPPALRRHSGLNKFLSAAACAQIIAAAAGVASAQTQYLQPAGDVILNVRSIDLDPANTVWTNNTTDTFSVGNLHTLGGGTTMITSLSYSDSIVGSTNVNALAVAQNGGFSMVSTPQVPAQILGHGTVSAEAWVYANDVGAAGATITSAVIAYGNVNTQPQTDHQRDFNYGVGNGNGAVSGYADDANWTPQTFPTAGVWHYLAYTYDGTTFRAYQDGVLNTTANKPNWNTTSGILCVGSDGATGGGDPFHGNIACARVMTGVLNASQILNNYNAGLFADYGTIALPPVASPGTNAFLGDVITLTETAQATTAVTYQWETDGGAGGTNFTAISGATNSTLAVNTGLLTAGNYQYEVQVTGISVAISPPIVIKVNPASKPVLSADISPSATSNLFVGSGVTFTATFIGNQPIQYNWQFSNGGSFANISGATNSSLVLSNLQISDSGSYRLSAANGFGSAVSSATAISVAPLSALPQVQVAGSLIVQLESADLSTNSATWPNEIGGIGDFTTVNGTNLTVTNLIYNSAIVPAVAVGGNSGHALNSTDLVPTNIINDGAVSVEAWIYPTTISGNNTVIGYGVQGGSTLAASEDREFDFGNSGGSAFSGNFGGDTGWSGTLTANTWHYVAWTFDGTTLRCYKDGVLNTSNNNGPLHTIDSVLVVGAGIAGADPTTTNRTDTFQGDIASVRVSTGVLTASQIANNLIAGPTRTAIVVLSTPTLSPSNVVFYGDSVTATVTNAQSLQTLTYQWQSDNGSGGTTWSNITGQTGLTYSFSTTSLPRPTTTPVNYEFELVGTGNLGTVVTSAPVTLTIRPAAPPTVLADTTSTGNTLFVGQQVTFSAAFTGNQPITNQWQVSKNGGAYQNISGQTGSTLTLSSVGLSDQGNYRLEASNAFGTANSTPLALIVLPVSAEPQVAFAGEVIVNLSSDGLDTNAGVWHNETTATDSVGDFTFAGGIGLNVTNVLYNGQPLEVLNVAGVGNNSVEAINTPAPAILLGANPCTMEAWCFATQVNNNNTVVNYGDQSSNSGDLDRALNYQNQGYGAFTGYFGNADLGWNPAPTANVWHYIAVTYDGSNLIVYQDGVANGNHTGITLLTDESYISVGSGTSGGPFAGANPFSGLIAAARVETGVLTPAQIAANYKAGPAPGLITGVSIAQLAPLTSTFANGMLTLSWSAGTLQEAPSINGPWTSDTGFTSPHAVNPSAAGGNKFYRLQY